MSRPKAMIETRTRETGAPGRALDGKLTVPLHRPDFVRTGEESLADGPQGGAVGSLRPTGVTEESHPPRSGVNAEVVMPNVATVVREDSQELAHADYRGQTWTVFRRKEGGFSVLSSGNGAEWVEWPSTARELLGTLFRRLPSPPFAELAWALLGKVF